MRPYCHGSRTKHVILISSRNPVVDEGRQTAPLAQHLGRPTDGLHPCFVWEVPGPRPAIVTGFLWVSSVFIGNTGIVT